MPSGYLTPRMVQNSICIVVVQSLSQVRLCDPVDCSVPGFPVPHHLLEFAQTHVHELVMPSNHLIFCHPLLLSPSNFPSIRVISIELAPHIRWPECWNFSIGPSNEYSELISFGIDWFDLLSIQGTLKSLLQHHSSKASSSALSLLYGTTLTSIHDYGKNHYFGYMDLCQQSTVSDF